MRDPVVEALKDGMFWAALAGAISSATSIVLASLQANKSALVMVAVSAACLAVIIALHWLVRRLEEGGSE